MPSNPNRPDLPEATLAVERATIVGGPISQMLFGIAICVFFQTMYHLIHNPPHRHERCNIPLIVLTFVIFALGTVFTCMDIWFLKVGFVDNRNFPGGPIPYLASRYGEADTVVPNSCAIVSDWIAGGFLLYRCFIVFHMNFAILVLPCPCKVGTRQISMGVMVLFQSSRPNADLWTRTTVNFGLPYYSLSAGLNVLITFMILFRLSLYRRSLQDTLGREQAASLPVASISAMLTESSLLYAVASILFLVPYGLESSLSNLFIPILIQAQLLAPLLIIYRVAKRQGWDKGTANRAPTTLCFNNTLPLTSTRETPHEASSGGEYDVLAIGLHTHDKESASSSVTAMGHEMDSSCY
ncbi:hypothetical protein FB45DRAFT_825857 [Roridomyces roridus]|uniref:Uncharacterized protein n=1 Tax=Roridomyces roridus TaxID=1738132 RepID=A0AAD7C871_9AGAR|nr:hypothetical protein FB45DRAFT_825857 [Roridomyces roridus]